MDKTSTSVAMGLTSRKPAAIAAAAMALATCIAGTALGQGMPLVPEQVPLQPAAQAAIDAAWLTPAERSALRVFHGVWDDRDLAEAPERAQVALNAWSFDDPALSDPSVPAELRAEALLLRGELQQAIATLEGATSNRAARIRAEAFEGLGDQKSADKAVDAPVRDLLRQRTEDTEALTEGVRALVVRARIQGQPSRDYQEMMDLLGRAHQQLDHLYWPARLSEARLLIEKDNVAKAVDALHETLSLNPRCAEAWYTLGRVALGRFDFDSVTLATDRLHRIDRHHALADLLEAESRLVKDDPDGARLLLGPLLARWPTLRPALALFVAAEALGYDDDARRAALDRFEALSPGSPLAHFVAGRYLSLNRQYELAAAMLDEAIRRQPAWPAPQIELGLLLMQSGRDDDARELLESVTQLDPFNKRAGNSLLLLQELAGYAAIESPHFVIRYQPGVDEVMVRMMVEPLEKIHADVSARFQHEPDRKTTIELLPDHKRFAVRITGMPWIHTIAACTGPVIALEVPRDGPPSLHQGPFDWARVIRHEYTHTITLSQTRNRIPHWLTEAAAVSMEEAPRDYKNCLMLASALHAGALLDLDEIKWAFVRPRHPGDRALAYAQGDWMVEYMTERFGESAVVRLINRYFDGVREEQAMPQALGLDRAEFFTGFLEWAEQEVESWGLSPEPTLEDLKDELRWGDPDLASAMAASLQARLDVIAGAMVRRIGRPADSPGDRDPLTADRWPALIRPPVEIPDAILAEWLEGHPDHPDLLELAVRRRLQEAGDDKESLALLARYAAARPVDPFPDKKLAEHWLDSDTPQLAIPHLERLDELEQKTAIFAFELASQYRAAGDLESAMAKATRAVQIDPFNAPRRELAAAIAIEARRLDLARQHIVALTLIEPDRPVHARRLEAIDKMLRRSG